MLLRGFTLFLAGLFAAGILTSSAEADHRTKHRRVIVEDDYYPGPPIMRVIPGLRIFFGDYALSEEEFDALYGKPRRVYREDEDEPPPSKPRRKAVEADPEAPKKPRTASKPATGDSQKGEPKKAATKTAAASSALSCDKATSVVSGYGFTSVTPSNCSGKVYAFNATRDGKSFAIKLDPKSGELTEVKKLP